MNKLKEFFKSRAFYIAFGTGILCFSGLLLAYNYSENRQGLRKEQSIDLNEPEVITEEFTPVESDGVLTGDEIDAHGVNGTYGNEQNGKDNRVVDEAEVAEEEEPQVVATLTDSGVEMLPVEEEVTSVASDYVESMDEVIDSYSYQGEQSLAWPLNGDIILPYSMDTTVYFATLEAYKCNPGILISGSEGTNIVSAYDGVVESIVEDKEYGTVVTVNMGNGYTTSYGQLMNITVSEGEEVVLGQVLGELAPVTSYYTQEGTHLYFEMNKDGQPVNPLLYIQ